MGRHKKSFSTDDQSEVETEVGEFTGMVRLISTLPASQISQVFYTPDELRSKDIDLKARDSGLRIAALPPISEFLIPGGCGMFINGSVQGPIEFEMPSDKFDLHLARDACFRKNVESGHIAVIEKSAEAAMNKASEPSDLGLDGGPLTDQGLGKMNAQNQRSLPPNQARAASLVENMNVTE